MEFTGYSVEIPKGPSRLFVYFDGNKSDMSLSRTEIQEFGPINSADVGLITISGDIQYISNLVHVPSSNS